MKKKIALRHLIEGGLLGLAMIFFLLDLCLNLFFGFGLFDWRSDAWCVLISLALLGMVRLMIKDDRERRRKRHEMVS